MASYLSTIGLWKRIRHIQDFIWTAKISWLAEQSANWDCAGCCGGHFLRDGCFESWRLQADEHPVTCLALAVDLIIGQGPEAAAAIWEGSAGLRLV